MYRFSPNKINPITYSDRKLIIQPSEFYEYDVWFLKQNSLDSFTDWMIAHYCFIPSELMNNASVMQDRG